MTFHLPCKSVLCLVHLRVAGCETTAAGVNLDVE